MITAKAYIELHAEFDDEGDEFEDRLHEALRDFFGDEVYLRRVELISDEES